MNILVINHNAGSIIHGMELRTYAFAREWTKSVLNDFLIVICKLAKNIRRGIYFICKIDKVIFIYETVGVV